MRFMHRATPFPVTSIAAIQATDGCSDFLAYSPLSGSC